MAKRDDAVTISPDRYARYKACEEACARIDALLFQAGQRGKTDVLCADLRAALWGTPFARSR